MTNISIAAKVSPHMLHKETNKSITLNKPKKKSALNYHLRLAIGITITQAEYEHLLAFIHRIGDVIIGVSGDST